MVTVFQLLEEDMLEWVSFLLIKYTLFIINGSRNDSTIKIHIFCVHNEQEISVLVKILS